MGEASMIGRSVRRLEDRRLITGRGRYLDDLNPPGCVYAVFVRSPFAHATVGEIDATEARAMSGVLGVFAADDLGLLSRMPNMHPSPGSEDTVQGYPLARDEVCYVGEPVAVVVAEDPYVAADAAASVFVDHEPLPACVDHTTALQTGAPPVHSGSNSNLATRLTASYGEVDEAFRSASHVHGVDLRQHRGAAASIEPRGVLADFTGVMPVMWSSTQSPHKVRDVVSAHLGIDDLRVIAPDVGGGFGPKGAAYTEEYVVPALARTLGRPVKWVEGRREHFLTTHQQRDQTYHLEVAFDHQGVLAGLRGRVIHDNGAYVPYGFLLPMTGLRLIPGPYVLPAMDVTIDVVYTNLVPTSPIRGAARPNAVFAMERVVDSVARALSLDPAEVRRRNFAPSDEPHEVPLPSRTGEPIRYDGGDYSAALDAALDLADTTGFVERKESSESKGRRRGIGIASYVEDTGLGPSEGAAVGVGDDATVEVRVGVSSQGQGHATVFAQLAASVLGVGVEDVVVIAGDTAAYPTGISTVASRTAVTAGPAVHGAAIGVAEKLKRLAAEMLEASEDDLIFGDGQISVVGQPDATVSLEDVVGRARSTGRETELKVAVDIPFGQAAYAFGTHVAEVEVDVETGLVEVVAYSVAHDCGTVLNPMIVAGQIDGGVAHGLGNALLERVAHTPEGQPLVTSFVDYRIMGATEVPSVRKIHTETPSSTNTLGVRGAGEGGTIPAAAAVAAAVENALADLGVVVDSYPLHPEIVLDLIRSASDDGATPRSVVE